MVTTLFGIDILRDLKKYIYDLWLYLGVKEPG